MTSVAITWSQCAAASNAWMPLPVPTSSARPARRRGVSAASQEAVGVYGATKPTGSSAPRANPSNAIKQAFDRDDARPRPQQRAVELGEA